MLDGVLYGIIAAFLAWEGVAHWLLKNRSGHTASNRILWLEQHGPRNLQLVVRILVACATVALGVHLQGVF